MEASLRDNPTAIFDRIMFCHDLKLETVLPARIIKVFNNHTALAQSLNKLESSTGEIDCAPILVTTFWDFHGGFEVHHPLNVGDTGWLIGAMRNTDLVKQYNSNIDEQKNAGPQTANADKNLHKSRFGFFFPDRWDNRSQEVPDELKQCFCVKDRNGWCRIILDDKGHIDISAKSSIEIFGETLFENHVTFNDDVNFTDTITVDGASIFNDITVKGKATFKGDVVFNRSIFVNGNQSRINDMNEQELVCVTDIVQDSAGTTKLKMQKMNVMRSRLNDDKTVEITVSSGGDEPTPPTPPTPTPAVEAVHNVFWFDEENHTVRNCRAIVGRSMYYTGDFDVGENYTGNVFAIITHSPMSISLAMSKTQQQNNDNRTCFQVYYIYEGKVYTDYRGAPVVPLYE